QVEVHAEDVQPRGPGHHADGAVRIRPARAVQPGKDLPHPAAVRRAARPEAGAASAGRFRAGGPVVTSQPTAGGRTGPAPSGAAAGTVGGVLATGMAGPRRLRYGTPRDLVIGITVVRADGQLARSGGKVVKNVAGYDLGKLFAGSFGTLGLIAEATFRLHPVPAAARYVTLECG